MHWASMGPSSFRLLRVNMNDTRAGAISHIGTFIIPTATLRGNVRSALTYRVQYSQQMRDLKFAVLHQRYYSTGLSYFRYC